MPKASAPLHRSSARYVDIAVLRVIVLVAKAQHAKRNAYYKLKFHSALSVYNDTRNALAGNPSAQRDLSPSPLSI